MNVIVGRKGWDAIVPVSIVVVGALIALSPAHGRTELIPAGIVLVLMGVAYYSFGRRSILGTTSAYVFQGVLIAGITVGTWFQPNMLTLQVMVLPILWCMTSTTLQAIALNTLTCVLLAFSFALGLGGGGTVFIQGAIIQGISLAFSIALGLWVSRIADQSEENARLLAELTTAQAQLDLLSREAGAADERGRLAREIHDTIAQSLTGLVMLAQRAQSQTRNEPASKTISLIESMARDALGEARALVAAIAAVPELDAGLADSIRRLGERFERETGVAVTTTVTTGPLARDLEVVLLRCVQEALANVRKHSGARCVSVTIDRQADVVRLVARDDGRGLQHYRPDREQGFGLSGMRDRIRLVGGELRATDAAGGGAELTVTIPTDRSAPAP